jgi:hypothetical protein
VTAYETALAIYLMLAVIGSPLAMVAGWQDKPRPRSNARAKVVKGGAKAKTRAGKKRIKPQPISTLTPQEQVIYDRYVLGRMGVNLQA